MNVKQKINIASDYICTVIFSLSKQIIIVIIIIITIIIFFKCWGDFDGGEFAVGRFDHKIHIIQHYYILSLSFNN